MSKGNTLRKQFKRRFEQIETHILQILEYIEDIKALIPDALDKYGEDFDNIQMLLVEIGYRLRELRNSI